MKTIKEIGKKNNENIEIFGAKYDQPTCGCYCQYECDYLCGIYLGMGMYHNVASWYNLGSYGSDQQ